MSKREIKGLNRVLLFIIKLLIGIAVFSLGAYLIAYYMHFVTADTFTVIGVIVIACGLFSVVGNMNMSADTKYYQALSVSEQSFGKKALEEFKARDKSLSFLLYMVLLGGSLIAISYLV